MRRASSCGQCAMITRCDPLTQVLKSSRTLNMTVHAQSHQKRNNNSSAQRLTSVFFLHRALRCWQRHTTAFVEQFSISSFHLPKKKPLACLNGQSSAPLHQFALTQSSLWQWFRGTRRRFFLAVLFLVLLYASIALVIETLFHKARVTKKVIFSVK